MIENKCTVGFEGLWLHFTERSSDVGAQALGWLVGHLDTVLQNTHGETLGRHGAEEEAVVRVNTRFWGG